jgi:hypothetical protein
MRPAVQATETWVAMKCGKARMLEFRTYPQGRFEVLVRSWRLHDVRYISVGRMNLVLSVDFSTGLPFTTALNLKTSNKLIRFSA